MTHPNPSVMLFFTFFSFLFSFFFLLFFSFLFFSVLIHTFLHLSLLKANLKTVPCGAWPCHYGMNLLYLRASFSMQKAADLHSFWWHHASLHSRQSQPQWDLCYNKTSSAGHWDATLKVPESCKTCLVPSEPWKTPTAMKTPMHFKNLLGVIDFHLLVLSVVIIKYCHLCNQVHHTVSSETAKEICNARHNDFLLNAATEEYINYWETKEKYQCEKKITLEN